MAKDVSDEFLIVEASFLLDPEIWRFLLPKQTFEELPTASIGDIFEDDDLDEEASDHCLVEFVPHRRLANSPEVTLLVETNSTANANPVIG